jgi:hypothetical protein
MYVWVDLLGNEVFGELLRSQSGWPIAGLRQARMPVLIRIWLILHFSMSCTARDHSFASEDGVIGLSLRREPW